MKLFIDTETCGLPKMPSAPPENTANWPRLVQLAWTLTDGEQIVSKQAMLIKPEGFEIPAEATRIHGVSTYRATHCGSRLRDVLKLFASDADGVDMFIAHNIQYDASVVGAELVRCGMPNIFRRASTYCTMRSTVEFCGIPRDDGFKLPSLTLLHYRLFGRRLRGVHDARADCDACHRCYRELERRGALEMAA